MNIYHTLSEIPPLKEPIHLSIGMFDGLHLGHQSLLKNLTSNHGTSVVLTFINHPTEIFTPELKKPMLTTTSEKTELLKEHKIDGVITLSFTKEIAEMTYQMFLKEIHTSLPFKTLTIGKGDAFGKGREGDEEAIKAFAPSLGFVPHYIPKLTKDEKIISSSWIRACLQNGDLLKAEELLGRPISFSSIDKGLMKPGTYKVRVLEEGKNTFSEKEIKIDEDGGYYIDTPSVITFITNKGNQ